MRRRGDEARGAFGLRRCAWFTGAAGGFDTALRAAQPAASDDDKPQDLENSVLRGAYGYPYLIFETRLVQIPALEMETYRRTTNRVALSFLPNMRGSQGVESVLDVTIAFLQAGDPDGVRLLFAFWVVEGRLDSMQQDDLNQRLKERDMPEIIDWWRQEGIDIGLSKGRTEGVLANKMENARKMREHGIAWEIVTDVTGIKPEDLT